ncbi:DUF4384 domain-containing protein [Muricauda sp. CAU 1633]|uniref:C1 family peptidase n=1 Tax=Allomuricauda sp. CAU 1633 TaxID=2816036 RepID=UPI001A8E04C8|nr:C1 family peptidase [Muricauda sp. CAU 1633]MBO0323530.1 DUF4384 domain-containing protein [Muricauda sp. CAU 1633]
MRTLLLAFVLFSSFAFGQNQRSTGLLFDDEAYERTPIKAKNVAFQDVVTEFRSATLKQFVPNIKDQGGYGTCVGWSSAYYGRTILEARLTNEEDSIQINENTFSPVFTYLHSNVENDYNCQGGAFIGRAMEAMIDLGVPYYKDFDVMCETNIPETVLKNAQEHKIKDYTRIFGSDEPQDVKIDGIKRSLLNGNPVIIGFKIENAFFSAKTVYEPDNLGTEGGHAMCVIGYDDDKYGGAFEIVNSWGPSWGNDGFMWIRYNDFVEYTRYAFEMIPQVSKPKTKTVLAGELELRLRDNTTMEVSKGDGDYQGSVFGFQDVVIEDESQSIGDYITTSSYPTETRYQMITKVNQPAYVYVLGADSDNENSLLFPYDESVSPFINSDKAQVTIPYAGPNQKAYFRLNKEVESDYSIVIFSLEKIDMPAVKKQLDEMNGDLLDKLYIIFNDQLINKDEVELMEEKMGFTAEFSEGSMAMMILDIKRT